MDLEREAERQNGSAFSNMDKRNETEGCCQYESAIVSVVSVGGLFSYVYSWESNRPVFPTNPA